VSFTKDILSIIESSLLDFHLCFLTAKEQLKIQDENCLRPSLVNFIATHLSEVKDGNIEKT
jgi:hypothetical protein